MRAQKNRAASCLALMLATMAFSRGFAAEPAADAGRRTEHQATLRGRVVCVPEEMNRLYGADLPTAHPHIYGFKTTDGKIFTLLRTKLSEGLFVDAELRQRELILTGRVFPDSQVFEMTNIRSVKNGVVYDVYYWCEVCAIKTLKPGECMCCQAPVVLTEKRVESK